MMVLLIVIGRALALASPDSSVWTYTPPMLTSVLNSLSSVRQQSRRPRSFGRLNSSASMG